ncbi:MAG: hypothetical protein ACYTAO_10100 [Planctomycetota bacterium]
MKDKTRTFSKRNIIILSVILFAILIAVSIVGILLVRFSGPILFVGHAVISPFQDILQQDRLLCRTDHKVLLAECRELHRQLSVENPEIDKHEYIKVPDSELSNFPVIRRLGGRVFASINGAVWIELGDTMRHFGITARTEDFLNRSSSDHSYGDRELVPGLWYRDDRYNRRTDYDKVVEKLLQRNKYR